MEPHRVDYSNEVPEGENVINKRIEGLSEFQKNLLLQNITFLFLEILNFNVSKIQKLIIIYELQLQKKKNSTNN